MNKFQYDVFSLIGLIQQCPCIWDKENGDYRNKILKHNAWREICTVLYEGFEDLDQDDQREITQAITSKWANLRDAFMKSLKTTPGQPPKKKYIYYDQLAFLVRDPHYEHSDITSERLHQEDTSSLNTDGEHSRDSTYLKPYNLVECKTMVQVEPSASAFAKFKRKLDGVKSESDVAGLGTKFGQWMKGGEECESSSKLFKHTELDDDVAFFISVMPAVKRMSEDTKLDFRMGVMNLIKGLRKQDPGQT